MKMLSPKTLRGAMIWSAALHLVVSGGVIVSRYVSQEAKEPEANYVDLGYEVFDAPPVPVEEEQKVRKSLAEVTPESEPESKEPVARELQDASSDIQGTQKEQKVSAAGSSGDGTAASTPYYKIKPKYPRAALISGEEGWVLMSVDITENGEVENVRVIDGERKDVFQSEARRAVTKWKYRPFVDASGKPFKKRDHQVRVEFKMEDAESI